jgi:hypothetical protein
VIAGVALLVLVAQGAAVAGDAAVSDELNRRGDRTVGKYRLERTDQGGYVWHGPHLTASIAPDGRVRFADERPTPGQAVAPVLGAARAYQTQRPQSLLRILTNPTLVVSDEDLRHDTHHGPKMEFIETTAAFRADLRAAFDHRAQGAAIAALRQRVRAIATDPSRPLAERHHLVFELWQECEDSPGGAQARAAIEDEARLQLPAGTPRAFTTAELARLNAGEPRPFGPYARPRR